MNVLMPLTELLLIASLVKSTTYGYGELMCGDIGKPVPCEKGAITASGVEFDPDIPMAAVAAPTALRIEARIIGLQVVGGDCKPILLADKMAPKWIGTRGFDLTPAAVELLTGEPATPYWSGKVSLCKLGDEDGP